MKIIGITGKKRSGKDTSGEHLIKNFGFTRYSFADPLKKGCMEMFGFNADQMWGDTKEVIDERWGVTPREVLQIMGTNLLQFDIHNHTDNLKHIGREIWVHRFKLWVEEQKNAYAISKHQWSDRVYATTLKGISYEDAVKLNPMPEPLNIVITDVRFKHEVKAIREMGGQMWKVHRPSLVSEDTHLSETEIDNLEYDILITNDGSISDLYKKVEENLNGVLTIQK